MKTTNQNTQTFINKAMRIFFMLTLSFVLFLSCSVSDKNQPIGSQQQASTAVIKGVVKSQNGNVYPKTVITLSGKKSATAITNSDGEYNFNSLQAGNYSVSMDKPLAINFVSESTVSISLNAAQETTTNFIIEPQARTGVVVIGTVDIFGEIKDANGNPPITSTEPLYAENVYDAPLGLLTPIMAPDNDPIVLSEWEQASGSVFDTLGRQVKAVTFSYEFSNVLDVSGLKTGFYFLEVQTAENTKAVKSFIKN